MDKQKLAWSDCVMEKHHIMSINSTDLSGESEGKLFGIKSNLI